MLKKEVIAAGEAKGPGLKPQILFWIFRRAKALRLIHTAKNPYGKNYAQFIRQELYGKTRERDLRGAKTLRLVHSARTVRQERGNGIFVGPNTAFSPYGKELRVIHTVGSASMSCRWGGEEGFGAQDVNSAIGVYKLGDVDVAGN
jgi:hypothetical protein